MLKIKDLRVKKNMSQEEISEKTGISKRMIFDYENEKIDVPLSKMLKVAEYLEVDLRDLINYESPTSDKVQEPSTEYSVNDKDKLISILEKSLNEALQDKHFLKKIIESKLF